MKNHSPKKNNVNLIENYGARLQTVYFGYRECTDIENKSHLFTLKWESGRWDFEKNSN